LTILFMSADAPINPINRKGRSWNAALRSFLTTNTRREAERRFDWLHAQFLSDTITRVLTEELRRGAFTRPEEVYEAQETFGEISLLVRGKIFARLIALWEDRQKPDWSSRSFRDPIGSFHAYVVAVVQNACVDYLRRKYPGRHALDNALRAALDVRPDLALWRVPLNTDTRPDIQEWRCGRPEWRDGGRFPALLLSGDPLARHLSSELGGLDRAAALARVFEVTQAPLRFTQLLDFLADLWDVEAVHRNALHERADFHVPKPYLRGIQPEEVVDLMGMLQSLWGRVRRLSTPQAAVLLLKVPEHESGSFLDAMVHLEIAGWQDIAGITGLSVTLLQRIAESVPLTDHEIADVLDVAPEDVPRIRQDARRRLSRQQDRSPEQ
jgi:hypothetical protein